MKKINIIQFLPYFLPHKGGLEVMVDEFSYFYIKNNFGDVINVAFGVGQDFSIINEKFFIKNNNGKILGYKKKGYLIYVIPAFDLINNFPIPKIWRREFWDILKILKSICINDNVVIQTHTRFFLSSFLGGVFSKIVKKKWIHVEHGSDYVKLSSFFNTKVAYFYDRVIGKWIFKNTNKIVAISYGVKNFIQNNFLNRDVDVIYNGINFISNKKTRDDNFIIIAFVGRLVKLKGVDFLIESFNVLKQKYKNIKLEIVGYGDEIQKLKNISGGDVLFLGEKNRDDLKNFFSRCDILVNPSFQEGLPTVVLEGLLSECVVVATDVGGTKEISNEEDLIIVEKGDLYSITKGIEFAILNHKNISGKSKNIIINKFNWDNNIKKYFNLYKDE